MGLNSTMLKSNEDYLAKDNPLSIYSLLSDTMQSYVDKIPPEYFALPEKQLIKDVYGFSEPNPLDEKLRINMWREYEAAQNRRFKSINLERIYVGVCHKTHFMQAIANNPGRLAYILTPPAEYWTSLEEILNAGVTELLRIMRMPDSGDRDLDLKLWDKKIKIFQIVDTRQKGAVVQRMQVEQKNLNVNVDASQKETSGVSISNEELMRLKEMLQSEDQTLSLEAPKTQVMLPVERVVQEAGRVKKD